MKIVKYILIAAILLTIYITEPLWRVQSDTSATETSQIDKEIKEQQDVRKHLIAEETIKLRKLEEKFGKKPSVAYKSRVPKPLQAYWDQKGITVYDDICTRLKSSNNGWTTSCQYKVKGDPGLKFDIYIIRHGKIVR